MAPQIYKLFICFLCLIYRQNLLHYKKNNIYKKKKKRISNFIFRNNCLRNIINEFIYKCSEKRNLFKSIKKIFMEEKKKIKNIEI